ncbi:protein of unknown function [Nitrospira japonica]|uniref:Uncharacterized protein n=2 Tax=Nitrospira japonica TaxID=1325564 RepID=A0A1W1I1F8_9BACT|nr:protein of unknown function [Nitrospira japonica]
METLSDGLSLRQLLRGFPIPPRRLAAFARGTEFVLQGMPLVADATRILDRVSLQQNGDESFHQIGRLDGEDIMKRLWISVAVVLLGGCGPHYTIPNFESDEIEKVVSSGRSPQACIENLKEDATNLNVKVRLTDMHHEPASGPVAWIYSNAYVCTGKVVKATASSSEEKKAL